MVSRERHVCGVKELNTAELFSEVRYGGAIPLYGGEKALLFRARKGFSHELPKTKALTKKTLDRRGGSFAQHLPR
jgi:hypothetical protein